MDLMKELLEEREKPHVTDLGSWRGKAQDKAVELEKALGNVRWEDPDSDYYSESRAVKVTNYLKKFIERLEKDIDHINKNLGS